ncbi:MAG: ABC transporter ATP-binding protein [Actinobacteria bacterium]|nr:ABC transporter ATP-binding protein [Actinomycetota bacterium]
MIVACRGLRKAYGDRVAVAGVDLAIRRGERFGLVGPNGAGKTTLVSMLCGLVAPDAGEIELLGETFDRTRRDLKASIGYVPQETALYPDLTGRENLRFFGRLRGLRGAALTREVEAALEVVGLADRARDFVIRYSGGMQRRLNIAVGLLGRPQILALDEPTLGVDPHSRHTILETVAGLAREGTAVVYTTHYMHEVERLCDRIAVLVDGVVVAEDTTRGVLAGAGAHGNVGFDLDPPGEAAGMADACRSLPGVLAARAFDGRVELAAADGAAVVRHVLAVAENRGVGLANLEVRPPDLESVFLALTGTQVRD